MEISQEKKQSFIVKNENKCDTLHVFQQNIRSFNDSMRD